MHPMSFPRQDPIVKFPIPAQKEEKAQRQDPREDRKSLGRHPKVKEKATKLKQAPYSSS